MINQDVLNLNVFCNETNPVLKYIKIEEKQSIAANGNLLGIVSNPADNDAEYPLINGKETLKETYISAKTAKNFKMLKSKNRRYEKVVLLKKEEINNAITLFNTNLDSAQSVDEVLDIQSYPEYQKIIPTEEPIVEIEFDIRELKKMVDYLAKFDTREWPIAKLSLYGTEKPMKLECTIPDVKNFTGLIMPLEINK